MPLSRQGEEKSRSLTRRLPLWRKCPNFRLDCSTVGYLSLEVKWLDFFIEDAAPRHICALIPVCLRPNLPVLLPIRRHLGFCQVVMVLCLARYITTRHCAVLQVDRVLCGAPINYQLWGNMTLDFGRLCESDIPLTPFLRSLPIIYNRLLGFTVSLITNFEEKTKWQKS